MSFLFGSCFSVSFLVLCLEYPLVYFGCFVGLVYGVGSRCGLCALVFVDGLLCFVVVFLFCFCVCCFVVVGFCVVFYLRPV